MQPAIGNYTLIRPLGEGGMGTVYLAQHQHLQYYAVVKSLHPHYAQNEALRQRFYTEAQLMAQVAHPAIVRLYDFVIQDGVPYLIMEYVHGTPLDNVLATRGALAPEEAFPILAPIWEALTYLHSRKIVHRDIKPSNIMVLPEGGAKLIDFGIAKSLDNDYRLTQTGMQVGTVLYMAPEQIQGAPVSPQTDLYAMGLVAYECLFGRFPWDWQGKTQFQLYQMLLTEAPPIPQWVPPEWRDFFNVALAKDPKDRYASAEAMAAAFATRILRAEQEEEPLVPEPVSQPSVEAHTEASITPAPPAASLPARASADSPAPPPSSALPPRKTTLPVLPVLLLLIVGIAVLVAFIRYRAHKHRQELRNHIAHLIDAYNAANEAPLQKDITRYLKKALPNVSISSVSLLEVDLPSLSDADLERFERGEPLSIYGTMWAQAEYSYNEVTVAEEERECTYETGFLFWRERYVGLERWAYQVITPYQCEAKVSIPCVWQLWKDGQVSRTIDKEGLSYKKSCTPQPSYRGQEWPISGCR
jgi:serine/threonine protein kinase